MSRKTWRTVATRRGPALRLPDGALYFGTASEVRELRMLPERRRALASAIRLTRAAHGCASDVRALRRDAIMFHLSGDMMRPAAVRDVEILTEAAARACGNTVEEFVRGFVVQGIVATAEACRDERLRLTRSERLALSCDFDAWLARARRGDFTVDGVFAN